MDFFHNKIKKAVADHPYGTVTRVQGLMLEVLFDHPNIHLGIGFQCTISLTNMDVHGEIVGFHNKAVLVMPMGNITGIGPGTKVFFYTTTMSIYPSPSWKGRVINALGEPIDDKGPLPHGLDMFPLITSPIPSHKRGRVGNRLDVGIKAVNTFLTCCEGQRMGIFAGSGVGKSMLMSMLARYHTADVSVIGLIGERGREVREFIESTLGEDGLSRSVVIVATSDEPALVRRQAAYATMAVTEYFRSQGLSVLCLLDSVTRFAMAQREIGLSVGEPPTTKGYPPSVFGELARLLERAGPGENNGQTTAFFTVLVDGDDHNEPIADAVRGILDGHIVLDRSLAERNHFPAINILKSISRMVPGCHQEHEQATIKNARYSLSIYEDMRDMIRLGAYRKGTDPEVDKAMELYPALSDFLTQKPQQQISLEESFNQLSAIFG